MAEFLESGALIDAILVLVALEALAFLVLYRRVSTAPRLFAPHLAVLWPTLLSGALLMLAVRLAITDAHPMWVASVLAAAGLSHVVDIMLRFRRL
ncbi:hypothetical protein ABWH92_09125 [Ahrensia marina]|uniref:hypothetical protein n=1 Tax=Ahrensia marina TaxID=1514904 RepID=UPI0035CF6448